MARVAQGLPANLGCECLNYSAPASQLKLPLVLSAANHL